MTNKERTLELMKRYNSKKAIYSKGLDFESKAPNGVIAFINAKNDNIVYDFYSIYNAFTDDNVSIFACTVTENSPALQDLRDTCKEELNANL